MAQYTMTHILFVLQSQSMINDVSVNLVCIFHPYLDIDVRTVSRDGNSKPRKFKGL